MEERIRQKLYFSSIIFFFDGQKAEVRVYVQERVKKYTNLPTFDQTVVTKRCINTYTHKLQQG
jgi:hypothetical protein